MKASLAPERRVCHELRAGPGGGGGSDGDTPGTPWPPGMKRRVFPRAHSCACSRSPGAFSQSHGLRTLGQRLGCRATLYINKTLFVKNRRPARWVCRRGLLTPDLRTEQTKCLGCFAPTVLDTHLQFFIVCYCPGCSVCAGLVAMDGEFGEVQGEWG